ncbi:vWA domain-containing protein [Geopsychrobacter electrodiphilus]|uniref:vWA domain-containing protein n=1 Tax=Geopsychrobacter electrodiphilus TaxID=225196 RepID=UPI00037D644D|nr:VWA domain-containing protein [Geopsychrobacter electrodiphilus]
MSEFHFLRPDWLWGLPPALLLLVWLARRQLRSRSWQAVCDPELLPHLLLGRSVRRANWPLWLLLLGLLLALLALAGPVWKRQPQPLFRPQSALVVLFDLSRSMQAADLKPSRFLRARLKIEDLLRQRKEGQTALIVFAADAFTVTPLTEDRHTIEALLKSLDPAMMPAQGSDPARAMRLGEELLKQAGLKKGRLLLVTDEDRPDSSMDAARQLASQGYDLAVLGVGTKEGAPIPMPGGGFFKDATGNLVLPQLNVAGLQRLAKAGGGPYHSISVDDADLHSLLSGLDKHRLDQSGQSSSVSGDIWREEGVWLLWPLALLAAFAFRRGWLLVLPLMFLFPAPAQALSWQELWRTPNQQAQQSFNHKDYTGAAARFEDARWKASALYRAGKYSAAAKLLAQPQTADDFYNQGNALAKQGNLQGALKAYQQALKKAPDHADALYNKELVEKELQKQKQKKKDQQKKPGDKNSKGDQQQKSDDQQKASDQNQDKAQKQKQPSAADQNKQGKQKDDQSKSGSDEKQQKDQSSAQAAADKKAQNKPPASSAQDKTAEAQKPKPAEKNPDDKLSSVAGSEEPPPETAEQRESRMLLQQIPDDPGGLMRRKFLYQYRQRGHQTETDRSW